MREEPRRRFDESENQESIMHIPNTSLNIESRKIEQVVITGPSMAEAMDYCAKHSLSIVKSMYEIEPGVVHMGGKVSWIARIVAVREVQLVEV